MVAAFLFSVFSQLSEQIFGLRHAVMRHSVQYGQTVPQVMEGWQRLRRLDARLQSLVTKWRTGKLKLRPRKPAPPKPKPAPVEAEGEESPKKQRLSRAFGWYSKLLHPDAFPLADQLRMAMNAPEMAKLIAEAPSQSGRLLRPLCQMLGVQAGPIALPKRPRKPRPPTQAQRDRQAERAEAKEQRELAQTSSKASVVPKGHTFPTTARGWAIWLRRARRAERKRRRDHFKSA